MCGTSTIVDIRRLKVKEIEWKDMGMINLHKITDGWQVLVNSTMNFWGFQKIRCIYWSAEEIIASQERLSFREVIKTEQLRP